MRRSIGWVMLLAAAVSACGTESAQGRQAPADAEGSATVAVVVDSLLTMEEALERFRSGLEAPDGLRGGADSADGLVRELVRLTVARDTAAIERLALSQAEFGYLYFPTSPLAGAPYELPPDLAWFQIQQQNRIGASRLLRELGGERLEYVGLECERQGIEQGPNRLWGGCTVRLRQAGAARDLRLFGSLIERDGQFKLLSLANDF